MKKESCSIERDSFVEYLSDKITSALQANP